MSTSTRLLLPFWSREGLTTRSSFTICAHLNSSQRVLLHDRGATRLIDRAKDVPEQMLASVSLSSWKALTSCLPGALSGVLKQQGQKLVFILHHHTPPCLRLLSPSSECTVLHYSVLQGSGPALAANLKDEVSSSPLWLHSHSGRRSFASTAQISHPCPHKCLLTQVEEIRPRGTFWGSLRADLGWSICRMSMPMSQKPTVASSIGVNFSLTMLSIVTSALATSALTMYPPPNM